ncbi:tRNA (N(6)-L-threonylcarbamoyladenosine(37)-C(2))-methylthiotransferase MtaB [Candidatus Omnitrophota bacterium]
MINMKKVCNKVYGCKVNQYETQAVAESLEQEGYALTHDVKDADYVVINTCTVTHQSDRELEYYVRKVRRDNNNAKVFLLGCYVDHYSDKLSWMEGVDGVLKNDEKFSIAKALKRFDNEGCFNFSSDTKEGQKDFFGKGISYFKEHSRAFIKIQDGCNRVCSYCIVRIIRGKSRSRAYENIIEEVKRIVLSGYEEVVLTGVQLGAYGKDFQNPSNLAALLREISRIPEVKRIRLSSIEPMDIDDDLIECLRTNEKVCNHLHISLQSGDDTILFKMKRGYKRDDFIRLIRRLEREIEDFVYSTDIIVGFPGETEEAFQNTISLIREIPPMKIHVFPYSEREGTLAVTYDNKVPQDVKKARVRELLRISDESFRSIAERNIGNIVSVLVEKISEGSDKRFEVTGKSITYLPVKGYFEHKPFETIVPLKITQLNDSMLIGEPVA